MSLSGFLEYLEDHGKSPATTSAYMSDLRNFEPTIVGLHRYVESLSGYSASTRARKISSARSYCRWLEVPGFDKILIRPKQPPMNPSVMPREDIRLLFRSIRGYEPLALRDRAIFHLLLEAGCRASEIVNLTIDDVHLADRTVRIAAGSSKERDVPVSQAAVDAIKDYIERGRGRGSSVLFRNHRGSSLTRQGLWVMLRARARQANIGTITASLMRDTMAVDLIRKESNHKDVQHLLGISNVTNFKPYVQLASRIRRGVTT